MSCNLMWYLRHTLLPHRDGQPFLPQLNPCLLHLPPDLGGRGRGGASSIRAVAGTKLLICLCIMGSQGTYSSASCPFP